MENFSAQASRAYEDTTLFGELLPNLEIEGACGNPLQGTIFDKGKHVPYGPDRDAYIHRRYKPGSEGKLVDPQDKAEKRPIEQDEQAFFHGQVYGTLVGGFAYILSLLVKEGLEIWIMGIFLLLISSVTLALWLVIIGPAVTWFVDPQNEMDRGWHNMWNRVNTFFSATLAFVVVQTATEIFLSTWKSSGTTPYESVAYLLAALTIFYGTFNVIRRIPAAKQGRRELF